MRRTLRDARPGRAAAAARCGVGDNGVRDTHRDHRWRTGRLRGGAGRRPARGAGVPGRPRRRRRAVRARRLRAVQDLHRHQRGDDHLLARRPRRRAHRGHRLDARRRGARAGQGAGARAVDRHHAAAGQGGGRAAARQRPPHRARPGRGDRATTASRCSRPTPCSSPPAPTPASSPARSPTASASSTGASCTTCPSCPATSSWSAPASPARSSPTPTTPWAATVTLVSSRERVLPGEDSDAAELLQTVFERRGMHIRRGRAAGVSVPPTACASSSPTAASSRAATAS